MILFRRLPAQSRPWLLLIASALFYLAEDPIILFLATLITLITHKTSGILAFSAKKTATGLFLGFSVGITLVPLLYFKYSVPLFALLPDHLQTAAAIFLPDRQSTSVLSRFFIPAGISFWTFQLIAYQVDVYRGHQPPEKRFSHLLLFTLFFPQLIAGPIERAERLLEQLRLPSVPRGFDEGATLLIIQGLFKKLFVADRLAPFTHQTLASDGVPETGALFAGVIFAIQVYADFSGYTDMARGIARLLGVHLSENFRQPFLAHSPAEIWRRWHITLMAFFRDYLYIPLGGNRGSWLRRLSVVILVFTLGGMWHGSSAGMIAWGAFSGFTVAITHVLGSAAKRWLPSDGSLRPPGLARNTGAIVVSWFLRTISVLLTFLLFAAGASLMLAESDQLFAYANSLIHFEWHVSSALITTALFYALPLLALDSIYEKAKTDELILATGRWGARAIAILMMAMTLAFGSWTGETFVYFQF